MPHGDPIPRIDNRTEYQYLFWLANKITEISADKYSQKINEVWRSDPFTLRYTGQRGQVPNPYDWPILFYPRSV